MATGNRVSVKAAKPSSFSTTDRVTFLEERTHSGKSAGSVTNPGPSEIKSARTPYKLRTHRQSTDPGSSVESKTGETMELTKEQQQSRDIFGEDFDTTGPMRRVAKPPLKDWQMQTHSVEELESYAIDRSQDVTQNIVDCVRIAEETTGIATTTMEMLHEQGGQIRRTHQRAVTVESDLTVGEKLLGSLGGLFSRRWKPKKGEKIKGPQTVPEAYRRKSAQKERLAVLRNDDDEVPSNESHAKVDKYAGLSGAQLQLEMEKDRQDGALSDLGDVVSKLKNMTVDMNEEVEKQTAALGHMERDVVIIDDRVKQAYNRTRYLVGR